MTVASKTLLQVRDIEKRFGGLVALSHVSLTIRQGDIYGLIGPNGAGKTTLFNVLTGLYRSDKGRFEFDGHNLVGVKPYRVVLYGIARTFQNIRLFHNMTAIENVMVGRHPRTSAGALGAILRYTEFFLASRQACVRHFGEQTVWPVLVLRPRCLKKTLPQTSH